MLYVCPRRSHVQALASLVAPREPVGEDAGEPLVSEVDARRAARELARLRRQDPTLVPSMAQSAWHVPVRWFILFEDTERRLQEIGPGEWVIRYWAPIQTAAGRANRAASLLRRAGMHPISRLVRDLHDWLSSFDHRSAVELDYGEVAGMFTWDELDDDHSVAGVRAAVEAPGARTGRRPRPSCIGAWPPGGPRPARGRRSTRARPARHPSVCPGHPPRPGVVRFVECGDPAVQGIIRRHLGEPHMGPQVKNRPEAERLLTPAEVAALFRVDPKTVTRWAKAGKLSAIRTLGGHRRYREAEIMALLAQSGGGTAD